jgi:outer membrane protein OmpA-like peptidoglycan-associated protein
MVNRKRVDKTRLTAKGYGESQLINKCADNVNCTAEEHQVNRGEFIIIEL